MPLKRWKDWHDVERQFKAKRDPAQRVTLPKLRCLEEEKEDGIQDTDPERGSET